MNTKAGRIKNLVDAFAANLIELLTDSETHDGHEAIPEYCGPEPKSAKMLNKADLLDFLNKNNNEIVDVSLKGGDLVIEFSDNKLTPIWLQANREIMSCKAKSIWDDPSNILEDDLIIKKENAGKKILLVR